MWKGTPLFPLPSFDKIPFFSSYSFSPSPHEPPLGLRGFHFPLYSRRIVGAFFCVFFCLYSDLSPTISPPRSWFPLLGGWLRSFNSNAPLKSGYFLFRRDNGLVLVVDPILFPCFFLPLFAEAEFLRELSKTLTFFPTAPQGLWAPGF